MIPFKVGDRLKATVEKVVFGGPGLCRTDRGVIFVDYAAPDDQIELEISDVKKDYARGKIVRVLEPSSQRVDPACEYFTQCGGCDWQHLSAEAQIKAKQSIVEELFKKNFPEVAVRPIIASPTVWNYRNRIQLTATAKGLCYSKKRSHDFVPIQQCLIAEKEINQLLVKPQKFESESRVQISGKGYEVISAESESFEFSQVNTRQNQKLIELVLASAAEITFEHFFDLYCGSGNFAFPLLQKFPKAKGVGIELDASLIAKAQKVSLDQKVQGRMQFLCGSVDAALTRLTVPKESLILVDPPRAGLGPRVALGLGQLKVQGLIYISCNPTTLIRDLKDLTQASKWKVASVQPIDMFPQTSHIEACVTLV